MIRLINSGSTDEQLDYMNNDPLLPEKYRDIAQRWINARQRQKGQGTPP